MNNSDMNIQTRSGTRRRDFCGKGNRIENKKKDHQPGKERVFMGLGVYPADHDRTDCTEHLSDYQDDL